MKKWLIRFVIIITVLLLSFSHQDVLAKLSYFIIDGLIPGTHLVINTFCTYIFAAGSFYLIYKLIKSLRFDMLKREAILYSQDMQVQNNKAKTKKFRAAALEAEDLELVQRSL